MNVCTDYHFLQGILIIKYIVTAALIIVPFIIIILGTIDGAKAIIAGNQESLKAIFMNVLRRISCVAIILLMPDVLYITFNNLSNFSEVSNMINICYQNADSTIVSDLKRARLKELKEQNTKDTTEYITSYDKTKFYSPYTESSNNSSGGIATATGQGNFATYNLSDSQLMSIASLAQQEQGTAKGAAAEASLMANRFELYGSSYGTGAEGLINYVQNSGWFAHAATYMSKNSATDEVVAAVKTVLVEGKRTLPGYVDEHDCFSDISSATNDGVSIDVSNRSSYEPNKTILKNVYDSDSTYTFFSFPDSNSDPFGYTSEENRQKIGDDFYTFQ